MLRALVTLCLCVPLSFAADGQRDAQVQLPGHLSETEVEAQKAVREVRIELETIRRLSPEERFEKAARMERTLERLVRDVAGTRLASTALYWLAEWRFIYGDIDSVGGLLDQLESAPGHGYKGPARILRVRLFLRQGQTQRARSHVEQIMVKAPEFAPMLELVAFHERAGEPAPKVEGRNLNGTVVEPLTERREPFLIVCFANLGDPMQRFFVERIFTELEREEYQDRIRPIIVSFDGDPLGALTEMRQLTEREDIDLMWANPNPGGDGERWEAEWQLPQRPVTVLLGPDRSMIAVDPTVERLRPLVGLEPDDDPRTRSSTRRRFGVGGRR